MRRRVLLCACGVPLDPGQVACLKCDRPTAVGRLGWSEVDVAHQGQTAAVAARQADAALAAAQRSLAEGLTIIHGRGERLSLAVRNQAYRWLMEGRVCKVDADFHNPGVVRVWLKPVDSGLGR